MGPLIEAKFSEYLWDYSRTIPGKWQLLMQAYPKALGIIPCQLCVTLGLTAMNILRRLQAWLAQRGIWYGWMVIEQAHCLQD